MARVSKQLLGYGACAGTLIVALSAVIASAADPAKPEGPNADSARALPAETNVQAVYLSAQLAATGRAQKDPVMMIAAAKLLANAGGTPTPFTPEVDKTGSETQAARVDTPQSLLEEARGFASGNTNVLALIDQVAASGLRGAGGGPKFASLRLYVGAHATYRADFRGGELAEVAVRGEGRSELELAVFDDRNNLICRTQTAGDHEYCAWYPRWNGQFRLVVYNAGPLSNFYSIYTN